MTTIRHNTPTWQYALPSAVNLTFKCCSCKAAADSICRAHGFYITISANRRQHTKAWAWYRIKLRAAGRAPEAPALQPRAGSGEYHRCTSKPRPKPQRRPRDALLPPGPPPSTHSPTTRLASCSTSSLAMPSRSKYCSPWPHTSTSCRAFASSSRYSPAMAADSTMPPLAQMVVGEEGSLPLSSKSPGAGRKPSCPAGAALELGSKTPQRNGEFPNGVLSTAASQPHGNVMPRGAPGTQAAFLYRSRHWLSKSVIKRSVRVCCPLQS